MSLVPKTLLHSFCLVVLVACAAGEPVDRRSDLDIDEIRRSLGCTQEQVVVCVEVNCRPANYTCADRSELRRLFEPRIDR